MLTWKSRVIQSQGDVETATSGFVREKELSSSEGLRRKCCRGNCWVSIQSRYDERSPVFYGGRRAERAPTIRMTNSGIHWRQGTKPLVHEGNFHKRIT